MQPLHLVGFTEDRSGLVFTAGRGPEVATFVVAIDDGLVAHVLAGVVEPEESVPVARDPEPRRRAESALTPREIQSRLRSGHSVEAVAAEAGVDAAWVERFAPPVLAEQAAALTGALSLPMTKLRHGQATLPLGDTVVRSLAARGVELPPSGLEAGWSSRLLVGTEWVVGFTFRHRGRRHEAEWTYDSSEHTVVPRNRLAGDLGWVRPLPPTGRAEAVAAGSARPGPVAPPGKASVARPSATRQAPPTRKGTAPAQLTARPRRPAAGSAAAGRATQRSTAASEREAAKRIADAERVAARKAERTELESAKRAAAAAQAVERQSARKAAALEREAAKRAAAAARVVEQGAAKKAAAAARAAAARARAVERDAARRAAATARGAEQEAAKRTAAAQREVAKQRAARTREAERDALKRAAAAEREATRQRAQDSRREATGKAALPGPGAEPGAPGEAVTAEVAPQGAAKREAGASRAAGDKRAAKRRNAPGATPPTTAAGEPVTGSAPAERTAAVAPLRPPAGTAGTTTTSTVGASPAEGSVVPQSEGPAGGRPQGPPRSTDARAEGIDGSAGPVVVATTSAADPRVGNERPTPPDPHAAPSAAAAAAQARRARAAARRLQGEPAARLTRAGRPPLRAPGRNGTAAAHRTDRPGGEHDAEEGGGRPGAHALPPEEGRQTAELAVVTPGSGRHAAPPSEAGVSIRALTAAEATAQSPGGSHAR